MLRCLWAWGWNQGEGLSRRDPASRFFLSDSPCENSQAVPLHRAAPETEIDDDPSRPTDRKMRRRADQPTSADWRRFAGLGWEFVAALGLFMLLGWWLDSRWGTEPWLMVAGLAVGFALGLYRMLRVVADGSNKAGGEDD
jgi:F0F1-type ATP synthase assembly protein I